MIGSSKRVAAMSADEESSAGLSVTVLLYPWTLKRQSMFIRRYPPLFAGVGKRAALSGTPRATRLLFVLRISAQVEQRSLAMNRTRSR